MFSQELNKFLLENEGKKIVFTNGCFDILHRGHVTYLSEARKLGDLLIVGLNSDASVKRLKGPERPINNEEDRKYVLSQLKSVDHVEIFTEDTPLNLILKVKPRVLVKGGDWKIDQIVGGKEVIANGGDVFSLNFVDGYSTTSLINKIQDT
jgi:D-glycero-beta-D-manno-heptose 1-phosphate adenylyltransferase